MQAVDAPPVPAAALPWTSWPVGRPHSALAQPSRGIQFAPAPSGPAGMGGLVKRAIDVITASVLMIVFFPLVLLISLTIKLDSPGPVIIRQMRVGRNGRPFPLLKFRSMIHNAAELRSGLAALNEARFPLFKIRNDPRITRVGRYIRRASLDELPQLINVLLGDMSLVGPRPPFDHEVEEDWLRQSLRLRFRPGMTGLWQVGGRSRVDYDGMIRLDLHYTRVWSIWLDLKILAQTVPAVISGRGAC